MFKCPYCREVLKEKVPRCPHCTQFIIDPIIVADYPSIEKKRCFFCGKKIIKEASFCRFCLKWLDEINQAILDIDPRDLV